MGIVYGFGNAGSPIIQIWPFIISITRHEYVTTVCRNGRRCPQGRTDRLLLRRLATNKPTRLGIATPFADFFKRPIAIFKQVFKLLPRGDAPPTTPIGGGGIVLRVECPLAVDVVIFLWVISTMLTIRPPIILRCILINILRFWGHLTPGKKGAQFGWAGRSDIPRRPKHPSAEVHAIGELRNAPANRRGVGLLCHERNRVRRHGESDAVRQALRQGIDRLAAAPDVELRRGVGNRTKRNATEAAAGNRDLNFAIS